MGQCWDDLDVVYIPINFDDAHWLLAAMNFLEWTIYIYDSMSDDGGPHDHKVKNLMDKMSLMLGHMLGYVNFFIRHYSLKLLKNKKARPFLVKHVKDIP